MYVWLKGSGTLSYIDIRTLFHCGILLKCKWNSAKLHRHHIQGIMLLEETRTFSLWSPPTILMPRMCSSSSRSSNLSVLVVAGRPDLTFTSLTLPMVRSPFTVHLLINGLYFWGWSNLLTSDQTYNKINNQMLELKCKTSRKSTNNILQGKNLTKWS